LNRKFGNPTKGAPRSIIATRIVMSTAFLRVRRHERLRQVLAEVRFVVADRNRPCGNPWKRKPSKKMRPALGGELAAREPVWDGEGWGCDRVACLLVLICCYRASRALAVATAGRLSPSETQTFASLCD
jgi:hypothetical protein